MMSSVHELFHLVRVSRNACMVVVVVALSVSPFSSPNTMTFEALMYVFGTFAGLMFFLHAAVIMFTVFTFED